MKKLLAPIFIVLMLLCSCEQEVEYYTLPYPVSSLKAVPGTESVRLDWQNPSNTENAVGIEIRWSAGETELGDKTFESLVKTATIEGLAEGTVYSFSVAVVDKEGYTSSPVKVTGSPLRDTSRFYVNAAAPEGGNGLSWAGAFESLEDALENAWMEGDEIWVTAGTYLPEAWPTGGGTRAITDNARFRHFFLRPGVAVYGGFAGTETSVEQRNWRSNKTILSGDFNGDDADLDSDGFPDPSSIDENALHVIYSPENVEFTAVGVLDGFTITGGNADQPGHDCGGGIYLTGSRAVIRNCVFQWNTASQGGGGAYLLDCEAELDSCAFTGNYSAWDGGGLVIAAGEESTSSVSSLTDCIIYKNTGTNWGGGILIINGKVTMATSTVARNTVTHLHACGAGVITSGASTVLTLDSCIVWDNIFLNVRWYEIDGMDAQPVCTNCIIQNDHIEAGEQEIDGNYTGTGNSEADPGFSNIDDGDGADNIWFTADDGIHHL